MIFIYASSNLFGASSLRNTRRPNDGRHFIRVWCSPIDYMNWRLPICQLFHTFQLTRIWNGPTFVITGCGARQRTCSCLILVIRTRFRYVFLTRTFTLKRDKLHTDSQETEFHFGRVSKIQETWRLSFFQSFSCELLPRENYRFELQPIRSCRHKSLIIWICLGDERPTSWEQNLTQFARVCTVESIFADKSKVQKTKNSVM